MSLLADTPGGERSPARRWAVLVLPAAGAVLVALAAWLALGGSGGETGAAPGRAAATATVERRDLVESETIDGMLGYSGRQAVLDRLGGTITRLPRAGQVVRRGGTLFEVDGAPVVLMYGSVPAWRRLAVGVPDGPDVDQLERNLAALGHASGALDGHYDAATAAAVRRWQAAHDLPRTGAVELGRVAFLPGARRVSAIKATLGAGAGQGGGGGAGGGGDTSPTGTGRDGASPGGSSSGGVTTEILQTTSTRRVVTVRLDADKQQLAREGRRARVELPDGRVATGRIASVGRVARRSQSGGDDSAPGGEGDGAAQITVTIRLTGRGARTRLDQAPVTVDLARATRRDALSVPISALQGAPGGGYLVQVVRPDGTTKPRRVRPGLFADGYVEVAGSGLREGLRVAVPSR